MSSATVESTDGAKAAWGGAIMLLAAGLLLGAPALAADDPGAYGTPAPGPDPAPSIDGGEASATQVAGDRWLPWLGCWEPTDQGPPTGAEEGEEAAEADRVDLVCFRADPGGAGVLIQGVSNGAVTSEEPLVADGTDHPVVRSGCDGTERARFSEDGKRVFIYSELDCGAGVTRVQTGILAFEAADRWMEVQSVAAGEGEPTAGVRHFRAVDGATLEELGIPAEAPERSLAIETARRAAGQPLGVAQVMEAAGEVHAEAVEALLLEQGTGFALDAATLRQLAARGTPESVIDLMVALSHPERFVIDHEAGVAAPRADERVADARRTPLYADPFRWGFYSPYRFGFYRYGFYSPYGWGAPWGGWYGTHGRVVVIPVDRQRSLSRLVQGEGYTRGDRASPRGQAQPRGGRGAPAAADRPPRRSDPPAATGRDRSRVTPQGATRGNTQGASSRGSSSSNDDRRRARSRSGGN